MPTNPHILVCDDEMHIRAMIATKLRSSGFEVSEARTGEEGLVIAARTLPKLIVTDFQMPVMSGVEMATLLRRDQPTCNIPLIMLTARGYVLSPEQLAVTNIREVISKPFGVRQLLVKVQAILNTPDAGAPSIDDSRPMAA